MEAIKGHNWCCLPVSKSTEFSLLTHISRLIAICHLVDKVHLGQYLYSQPLYTIPYILLHVRK